MVSYLPIVTMAKHFIYLTNGLGYTISIVISGDGRKNDERFFVTEISPGS